MKELLQMPLSEEPSAAMEEGVKPGGRVREYEYPKRVKRYFQKSTTAYPSLRARRSEGRCMMSRVRYT